MANEEQRTETRSSSVLWDRLLNAIDPERLVTPEPAYRFSNGRTFEQPKYPYRESV
ncbi:MAG: hypothetical protein ACOYL3_07110 [Desulfuromonadaceae bacterium]